jgi:hypothetical protein
MRLQSEYDLQYSATSPWCCIGTQIHACIIDCTYVGDEATPGRLLRRTVHREHIISPTRMSCPVHQGLGNIPPHRGKPGMGVENRVVVVIHNPVPVVRAFVGVMRETNLGKTSRKVAPTTPHYSLATCQRSNATSPKKRDIESTLPHISAPERFFSSLICVPNELMSFAKPCGFLQHSQRLVSLGRPDAYI